MANVTRRPLEKTTRSVKQKPAADTEEFTQAASWRVNPNSSSSDVANSITALFHEDRSARAAITANLKERSAQSQALADRAEAAFAHFKPSRHTSAKRDSHNYLAPKEDLVPTLKKVVTDGVENLRASASGHAMTLHLNDELHTLIKEKRGKGDSIIGTIDLADLVDYVALKSGALPAQPNSPALTSCQAELEAEKRMREVEGATDKKSSKHDGKSIDAKSVTSHDHGKPTAAHPKVDQLVKDEVNLQMKTATSPESELAYSVAARADQKSTPTFELRAGPSDVTSYHDFNTLQIAFEHVWTEIFDGQLASLGEQLYHEYVKLKEFIGANDPDRPIHTIDDLRRLMDEVRKLAQFTDFVPTELTPSTVVGTGGDDITKAVADAARVGAAIATGGMSEVVNQFARLARGMVKLTWASFPGPLADGDVISVTIDQNKVPPGSVRFVLDTPPEISWWKAIRFAQYDPNDGKVSYSEEIWTQDQTKTANTSDLTLEQLQNGTLEFKKAATFGVHTGFYLMDAEELKKINDRSQVTFKWIKD